MPTSTSDAKAARGAAPRREGPVDPGRPDPPADPAPPAAFWAEAKERLIAQALAEGFSKVRITTPDAIPEAAGRLAQYLAEGRHGQMDWMEERSHWRGNPAALWPEARSVIMLAETYTPKYDPREILAHPELGAVSAFAGGRDYHDLVKKRLKRVGRWFLQEVAKDAEIKVFVDTAPVMEKPLAAAAGIGWQGKHTVVLSRDLGNWFFLGAIFTTAPLPPDPPEREHCGSCTACLDACPTQAFTAPFHLDPRRCISYLTIEHHGPVDPELRPLLGNRIFGCDDCLAACPWNKFAASAREMRYQGPEPAPLEELAMLDDAAFRARYAGTAIKRLGRNRFVRNVLYAIGNSGRPRLLPVARALICDPDPTVADAAIWAATRLAAASGDSGHRPPGTG